jgi:S1-C subfamily serine protease
MPDGLEHPDDDEFLRPLPPPPGDRAWRHPSELREPAVDAGHGVATRRSGSVGVAFAALVGVGMVVVGALVLAGALSEDPEPDVAAPRSVRDLVYVSSTTAAPGSSGWLGISVVEEPDRPGVTITECDPGSPAEDSLAPDDLIVAVDDVATPRMAQLVTVLAASAPGHTARIRLVRDGRTIVVPVVLGRQP